MTALWIAIGLLALMLAAALVRLTRVKRDIRHMGRRLHELTQTDTNTLLTTNTFDKDITALAESANALLSKSRRDYIETQRIEADLKRAIANISHDLRTPLTSAKGYLQMLDGLVEPGEKDAKRYMAIIQGRLETLAYLMDNLFAFSRALEEKIVTTHVNVCNVLRDVLSDSYAELENKGFAVESSIPDTPVYRRCNEDALKRVLQNLFKNAYVHGKEYLRVELQDNTISIANKADGLEDIDITQIFDRFYTADAARTKKRTGLGLAIAKELVEKMGGSITARLDGDMMELCVSLN